MDQISQIVNILSTYDVWNCDIEVCSIDKNLWELGMDSLTFVGILADIEKNFGIRYDLNKISESNLSSIAKLSESISTIILEKKE